jgi:hypothetical protein
VSEPALETPAGRELYVRYARLEGRSIVRLRAVDEGARCLVEADVWPEENGEPVPAGPYAFPSPIEATRFVTHAVEALIALGCEVAAS